MSFQVHVHSRKKRKELLICQRKCTGYIGGRISAGISAPSRTHWDEGQPQLQEILEGEDRRRTAVLSSRLCGSSRIQPFQKIHKVEWRSSVIQLHNFWPKEEKKTVTVGGIQDMDGLGGPTNWIGRKSGKRRKIGKENEAKIKGQQRLPQIY